MIRIDPLTLANFADFEALTAKGDTGDPCYCAFWHLKCASMADYDAMKRDDPQGLRDIMRSRVAAGFHVGALAYQDDQLLAWISVSPLPEVFWAWKRVATLGPAAATVAAITCLTIAPAFRGHGAQRNVAAALLDYGRDRGWTAIEAYPFDDEAVAKRPDRLSWPGFASPYEAAGYGRTEAHWLSQAPEFGRWICRAELG